MTLRRTIRLTLGLGVGLVAGPVLADLPADPGEAFGAGIRPLLEAHCYGCHGAEKQKGGVNFALYRDFEGVVAAPELWKTVLERVQSGEMPPAGSEQISSGQRQDFLKWLRALPRPKLDCRELASDRTQNFYRGYVMSRRLNRHEYANSIRDLFGVELNAEELLPKDGSGGEGFDNTGDTLFTSTLSVEKYLEAADWVVRLVLPGEGTELTGGLAEARTRLLVAVPGEGVPALEAARQVLGRVARRAYRRPVGAEEVDRLLTLFGHAWARGDGYEVSLRLALKAVLVSPHFLFLAEPEPEVSGVQPLAPVPLASRLSYFLWASMPDEELLGLAESGALSDGAVYRAQVGRMLGDEKAESLGKRFALQWLQLEGLGTEVRPDARRYPEFDAELSESMQGEAARFFNRLVREDRSLLDLIDCDYVMVNERLARLYGIPDVQGSELREVRLSDRNRGGVLGMGAVHAATSYPLRTSPVLRGKWVLEALLGDRVPPPPPGVPALAVNEAEVTAASLRAQLEQHRAKAECAACHDRMDPLGFGLENFDLLGRWQEGAGARGLDASGVLPSGERFEGVEGLKSVLMERKDKVIRHLARKMAGYAFGRELTKFDECVINDAMAALVGNGYRARVLIEEIANSFPFRHRFYAKSDS